MKQGSRTPWGKADGVTVLAPGIQSVTTPSHGGFKLGKKQNAIVHEAFRKADGWYEEDVEWAIVAFTFPDLFSAAERDSAHRTLKDYYPDAYTLVTGLTVTLAESHVLREIAFEEANRTKFVGHAAWGDWHAKVPSGFVGVYARKIEPQEEAYFLVPIAEYDARQGKLVIDETRHSTWTDHA